MIPKRCSGVLVWSCLAVPALADSDLLVRAVALHQAGKLTEALAAYRQAIDAGSGPLEDLAVAYNNACQILINLADPTLALDQCQRALELRRGLGDERGVARTLTNLGLALRHLGRYDEAESAYREALAINERRGDVAAEVRIRSNLGVLAMTAGRYGEAMRFHAAAEALAARHADEPWSAQQGRIARLNQGAVLEKLGAYREALELLRELTTEVGDQDGELQARAQLNLGVIYRNLGDPVRAVEAFEEAARTFARLGYEADLSNARLNLALALHLNLGRVDDAERAYREALDLARESGDRSEEIQDLFYLGNLELERGRVSEAEGSFRQCLELSEASGSAEGNWSALYGLGRVAEARGERREALGRFRRAVDEIETVRASLADPSRRSGYFGDKRPVYDAAVRVLAGLHRDAPEGGHDDAALAIVQQAKARQLLDALGAAEPPLGAAALRGLLGPEEAVLEYYRGGDDLYLWIVRHDDVRMVDLGPARPILDQALRVHEALASGDAPPAEAVARLSRDLLRTLPEDAGTLMIAPDAALSRLPFEILDAPGGLLLDRATVTYLPSASTLALLIRRREAPVARTRPPDRRFVGFGNPELPLDAAAPREPASLLVSRHGLGPLPAAEREVATIGRRLGAPQETRFGAAATESAFRELAASDSLVMHLATHTVFEGRGAAVLLAADGDHDGWLDPKEIAALDYHARLTVLASCRSALGESEADGTGAGQGLLSLTDAFLVAGSSAVVATLWEVDDAATATFMTQFYHQLGRGLDAAEALRRAKMRLRADPRWNRPGLWSAYVLVGEGVRVVDRPWLPAWSWVLAALLLAAGLGLGLRRRAAPTLYGSRAGLL